jgi:hypothetical protein
MSAADREHPPKLNVLREDPTAFSKTNIFDIIHL